VPFEVIPAIDLWNGRLATYASGGPVAIGAFGGDPMAAARSFAERGARWIHVVDLNLAYDGRLVNAPLLRAVRSAAPGLAVQASGGVRTAEDVDALLEIGADRVVLGSAALDDERMVGDLLDSLADRLVIGLEVAGGRIRARGANPVDLDLMQSLGWLTAAGAAGFLVTAVERVASLGGPDLPLVRRVVRAGRPVLVGGGVASLDDLLELRGAGAAGAVVGRAALEGDLDVEAAIAATAL
jgi:phosphoribosylformimino-5-aminoimidazole carboxamide ribonucleotide (ProFAR) isomerase